ncbi:hypothetical protein, partial [Pseudomonas aeruginosa]|uniref:hypothetical protein n=1 Tax=Pseudomonas aeruginosa TaxID=287 RepID=UPI001E5890B2
MAAANIRCPSLAQATDSIVLPGAGETRARRLDRKLPTTNKQSGIDPARAFLTTALWVIEGTTASKAG